MKLNPSAFALHLTNFLMLKKAVAEAIDRHGYDPSKSSVLESDASHYAASPNRAIYKVLAIASEIIFDDRYRMQPLITECNDDTPENPVPENDNHSLDALLPEKGQSLSGSRQKSMKEEVVERGRTYWAAEVSCNPNVHFLPLHPVSSLSLHFLLIVRWLTVRGTTIHYGALTDGRDWRFYYFRIQYAIYRPVRLDLSKIRQEIEGAHVSQNASQ